jgi:hypothetical protein
MVVVPGQGLFIFGGEKNSLTTAQKLTSLTGPNVIKNYICNIHNKLECLSLPNHSGYVKCLWEMLGPFPKVEDLNGDFKRVGSDPTRKHFSGLERLAGNKHSGLIGIFIIYGRKKFYNIWPR